MLNGIYSTTTMSTQTAYPLQFQFLRAVGRLVKKLTRRDRNISVSRRAEPCRSPARHLFAAGLAMGTEGRFPFPGVGVQHDNARRNLSVRDVTRIHRTV